MRDEKVFALIQRVLFHHFESELSFIKQGYFPCLMFQTAFLRYLQGRRLNSPVKEKSRPMGGFDVVMMKLGVQWYTSKYRRGSN